MATFRRLTRLLHVLQVSKRVEALLSGPLLKVLLEAVRCASAKALLSSIHVEDLVQGVSDGQAFVRAAFRPLLDLRLTLDGRLGCLTQHRSTAVAEGRGAGEIWPAYSVPNLLRDHGLLWGYHFQPQWVGLDSMAQVVKLLMGDMVEPVPGAARMLVRPSAATMLRHMLRARVPAVAEDAEDAGTPAGDPTADPVDAAAEGPGADAAVRGDGGDAVGGDSGGPVVKQETIDASGAAVAASGTGTEAAGAAEALAAQADAGTLQPVQPGAADAEGVLGPGVAAGRVKEEVVDAADAVGGDVRMRGAGDEDGGGTGDEGVGEAGGEAAVKPDALAEVASGPGGDDAPADAVATAEATVNAAVDATADVAADSAAAAAADAPADTPANATADVPAHVPVDSAAAADAPAAVDAPADAPAAAKAATDADEAADVGGAAADTAAVDDVVMLGDTEDEEGEVGGAAEVKGGRGGAQDGKAATKGAANGAAVAVKQEAGSAATIEEAERDREVADAAGGGPSGDGAAADTAVGAGDVPDAAAASGRAAAAVVVIDDDEESAGEVDGNGATFRTESGGSTAAAAPEGENEPEEEWVVVRAPAEEVMDDYKGMYGEAHPAGNDAQAALRALEWDFDVAWERGGAMVCVRHRLCKQALQAPLPEAQRAAAAAYLKKAFLVSDPLALLYTKVRPPAVGKAAEASAAGKGAKGARETLGKRKEPEGGKAGPVPKMAKGAAGIRGKTVAVPVQPAREGVVRQSDVTRTVPGVVPGHARGAAARPAVPPRRKSPMPRAGLRPVPVQARRTGPVQPPAVPASTWVRPDLRHMRPAGRPAVAPVSRDRSAGADKRGRDYWDSDRGTHRGNEAVGGYIRGSGAARGSLDSSSHRVHQDLRRRASSPVHGDYDRGGYRRNSTSGPVVDLRYAHDGGGNGRLLDGPRHSADHVDLRIDRRPAAQEPAQPRFAPDSGSNAAALGAGSGFLTVVPGSVYGARQTVSNTAETGAVAGARYAAAGAQDMQQLQPMQSAATAVQLLSSPAGTQPGNVYRLATVPGGGTVLINAGLAPEGVPAVQQGFTQAYAQYSVDGFGRVQQQQAAIQYEDLPVRRGSGGPQQYPGQVRALGPSAIRCDVLCESPSSRTRA